MAKLLAIVVFALSLLMVSCQNSDTPTGAGPTGGTSSYADPPGPRDDNAPSLDANQRPISDFVSAQGTTAACVPPVADFIGWASLASDYGASVDYAGLASAYLGAHGIDIGTQCTGSITERSLPDGRAQVHVVLHTTNALMWVVQSDQWLTGDWCDIYSNTPLSFGHRVPEILSGATPALGQSHFVLDFINESMGAPMPDLIAMMASTPPAWFQWQTLDFRAEGNGPCMPTGNPCSLTVSQTGHLNSPNHNPNFDGWPAEVVEIHSHGG